MRWRGTDYCEATVGVGGNRSMRGVGRVAGMRTGAGNNTGGVVVAAYVGGSNGVTWVGSAGALEEVFWIEAREWG